jgi:hypothetical protein
MDHTGRQKVSLGIYSVIFFVEMEWQDWTVPVLAFAVLAAIYFSPIDFKQNNAHNVAGSYGKLGVKVKGSSKSTTESTSTAEHSTKKKKNKKKKKVAEPDVKNVATAKHSDEPVELEPESLQPAEPEQPEQKQSTTIEPVLLEERVQFGFRTDEVEWQVKRARVLRIASDTQDDASASTEWKSSRNTKKNTDLKSSEMTKKQRENARKTERQRQAKKEEERMIEERRRQHQRMREAARMEQLFK